MRPRAIDIDLIDNLEQILATLRHEFGNSVTSIKITLDVLRENYDLFDDEKKKNYLRRISGFLAYQQRLIEAIKSYSGFTLEDQEEIAFLPFWENFFTTASHRLRNTNVRIIHNYEVGPCLIKADNTALYRVMKNIFDNAVDAVEGIDNPKIESKAIKMNDSVLILLKDNGSGIKENDMRRIFMPLFSTKPGNAGMGLPIAHRLLLKMEGQIEIESVFGNGTETKIWLRAITG